MVVSENGWAEQLSSRNLRRLGNVLLPADMDDKTINLWRQIEGARRVAKRQAGRTRSSAPSTRPVVAG
jgi:hypothetical protein